MLNKLQHTWLIAGKVKAKLRLANDKNYIVINILGMELIGPFLKQYAQEFMVRAYEWLEEWQVCV